MTDITVADETLPVETAEAETEVDALPRPRTRWAGIVWGLVFAALAITGLTLATSPDPEALATWVQNVEVSALIGYGLLAFGALLLVIGLVGLLRRAQRAASRR